MGFRLQDQFLAAASGALLQALIINETTYFPGRWAGVMVESLPLCLQVLRCQGAWVSGSKVVVFWGYEIPLLDRQFEP